MEVRIYVCYVGSLSDLCFISLDGVQVGNIASAFGIVGAWTTALHSQGSFEHTARIYRTHEVCPGDPAGKLIVEITLVSPLHTSLTPRPVLDVEG